MDRISLSTSRFFETQPKLEELRALIDNPTNSEREAAEGMKFLLAVRADNGFYFLFCFVLHLTVPVPCGGPNHAHTDTPILFRLPRALNHVICPMKMMLCHDDRASRKVVMFPVCTRPWQSLW